MQRELAMVFALGLTLAGAGREASACGSYEVNETMRAESAVWAALQRNKADRAVERISVALDDAEQRGFATVHFDKRPPLRVRLRRVDGSWRVTS